MSGQVVFLLILIGLFAGMLSGLIGVGGGIIIVPCLMFFVGFNQYQAQGTSLGLLLLPIGILAVMNYYNKGYIDIKYFGIMAVGFVIGGWLGSKISLALPEDILKKIFAVILFYTGIKMLGWDSAVVRFFKDVF
ncbi:MAG TPA: sulfite exporter TauE/SafE family protein [Flavisolibacter sp.]|nr:sulfite exporter TauE/SafE family protein [Flavisolibacter sp.]